MLHKEYSLLKIVSTVIFIAFISVTCFIYNSRLDLNVIKFRKYFYGNKAVGLSKENLNQLPEKHILLWTNRNDYPFTYFGEGNTVFVKKKCKWSNCYVTGDRFILGDYSLFDAIVFNGPQLQYHSDVDDLPTHRSHHQKYIYANIESAANYPVCSRTWNNFFNWTWTYKLNSDAVWGYFIVKNATSHIIGPSDYIPWMKTEDLDPVNEELKSKINNKNRAVAWFVSNCDTLNKREIYVDKLRKHLLNYSLSVDVYGLCGNLQCPKDFMHRCLKIVEKNYYFYLAFENANSEDYVTEKILNAFNYNTVPIVYGGANYSRFLPPKSYLNAAVLRPEELATLVYQIIQDPIQYYIFFKWKKYYSYHLRHENPSTDDYCHFCAMINDNVLMAKETIYNDFDSWWNHVRNCNYI